ncbi:hypothetical protein KCTCHS21_06930 [Cohnella abietis]|uniref:Uncharacterized protein n=1 Tax=Cohnella abietis TaxID=2507935 RepID=A0A3T1CZN5_9BACL|nr:hypothetical protein KCTCHS21_06930 [Cohnella abietis]
MQDAEKVLISSKPANRWSAQISTLFTLIFTAVDRWYNKFDKFNRIDAGLVTYE